MSNDGFWAFTRPRSVRFLQVSRRDLVHSPVWRRSLAKFRFCQLQRLAEFDEIGLARLIGHPCGPVIAAVSRSVEPRHQRLKRLYEGQVDLVAENSVCILGEDAWRLETAAESAGYDMRFGVVCLRQHIAGDYAALLRDGPFRRGRLGRRRHRRRNRGVHRSAKSSSSSPSSSSKVSSRTEGQVSTVSVLP